jgi:fructose 1,6-bisphosphatase
MIGAGIGGANIKLYHEFFVTGSTPLQKLGFLPEGGGVRGWRAIVRRTEDVLKGNLNGPAWVFEKSAAATVDGVEYPSKDESLELLALASQPNDYLITDIYPVEGSKLPSNEPVVSVVYQPVYGEEGNLRSLNPTFIFRSQSGADAVGGITGLFSEVNFVPGGPNGEYFVATKPVTLEEARKAPEEGIAYIVMYGWQSKNGTIPQEEGNIVDHVAINPPAFQQQRDLADWLASMMAAPARKDDQPYLAAFAAQQQVEAIRKQQAHLFTRAPKETDIDPVMDEVEAKVASGELLSVTDDKADMGGKHGHNLTPPYMLAINRATVIEAMEKGILTDGNIIGFVDKGRVSGNTMSIGDDSHILMLGDTSRNSANSHQLSFLAFTRGYYAAVVNGEKPYGLGQDYQGAEAQAAKANPIFYSQFSERFFEILREIMPLDYMDMVDKMEEGWREWLETKQEETVLPEPFSGNVSKQGIGSARYLVDIAEGERTFSVLAGDKMGPAALNPLIEAGVYLALEAGEFKNGLVFEIWDAKAFDENGNIPIEKLPESFSDVADAVDELKDETEQEFVRNAYDQNGLLRKDLSLEDKQKLAELLKKGGFVPTERIFLDAQEDREAIKVYLTDSDRFNIKQIWDKKEAGWDINNPLAYLNRPVLGSSVTKLGILAGGEYIGKDDPVMVGNSTLMEYIFKFLQDPENVPIIQGDMNGSHWLAAIPTAFKNAVATKDSHPILVGMRYTLSEDGKELASVEDVFGSPEYEDVRKELFRFNDEFKRAQLGGQFEPYGTNWRTVEASYPLAKLLRALESPNSPFRVENKSQSEQLEGIFRAIALMRRVDELFRVASGLWEP